MNEEGAGGWPWEIDRNPTAEGTVQICCVPPPEVPSQLCAGEARSDFYLQISITVSATVLSLVGPK